MEKKTKIALGIISTLLVGGGVWFLLFKKNRKKNKTFNIGTIICVTNVSGKDYRDCDTGTIQIVLSEGIENGSINAGDEIKIIDTDALLDGKYEVIKALVSKKTGILHSIVITSDYDIATVGTIKNKQYVVDTFKNKGKIVLIKHTK